MILWSNVQVNYTVCKTLRLKVGLTGEFQKFCVRSINSEVIFYDSLKKIFPFVKQFVEIMFQTESGPTLLGHQQLSVV